jgi:hypothetical protein
VSAPVLGVQGSPYGKAGDWQANFSWRYQKSHRHFVGSEEQHERGEDASQVINHVHIADLSLKYAFSAKTDISVSVPYQMATRSQAVRNETRAVIDRYTTQARGVGDVIVSVHRWLKDPCNANVQLGLGLKLPTGANNVVDTFKVYNTATRTIGTAVRTVDQSIQPGDGGFGFVADLFAYTELAGGNVTAFVYGTYLLNPEGKSGVLTYRGRASEAEMSIADQYLLRVGAEAALPLDGFSAGLAGRWEGVPAHDLIGSSDGFRRPGYAVSIEPSLSYSWGKTSATVAVPFALYRNRIVSVPDEADGTHGDAAFADWLLLLGLTHRF